MEVRHAQAGLGRAVALQRQLAERVRHALGQAGRQRRRAGDPQADGAEIGRGEAVPRQQPLVHRRHSEDHRPARALDRPAQPLGVEALEQHGARAAEQRHLHAAQAVLVRQRQRVDEHVVGAPAPREHRRPQRGQEVRVSERHALGPPRRPGRVRDHDELVRRRVLHRERLGVHVVLEPADHPQRRQPVHHVRVHERADRAAVRDQVLELGRRRSRVGRHHRRAGAQDPEVGRHEADEYAMFVTFFTELARRSCRSRSRSTWR